MKKYILICLICFCSFSVQARSFKLGAGEGENRLNQVMLRGCQNDSQCSSGLCFNGKCTFCSDKVSCGYGYCYKSKCYPPCQSNADCAGKGGLCQNLACVECTQDSDCKATSGQKCSKGQCVACDKNEKCENCYKDGAKVGDGAGSCKCSDDTIVSAGKCINPCELTTCPAGKKTTLCLSGSVPACCCE